LDFPFLSVEIGNSSHTHFNEILMNSRRQSVAIMGGAFDPVHRGHLSLAEDAYTELSFNEVWFVPTAESPLKGHAASLNNQGRIELLEAALEPYPYFKINISEIECGGVSYTIDSARRFRAIYPDIDFSWIIGGDQLMQLDKWKNIEELVQLVSFVLISRPGYGIDSSQIPAIPDLRFLEVRSRWLDIASSEIRKRLAAGKPVNDLLPPAVNDLIVKRNFYFE
jgi:nicotinate-nucleotide adenylyltransferase